MHILLGKKRLFLWISEYIDLVHLNLFFLICFQAFENNEF